MKSNMGTIDRIVRALAALLIGFIIYDNLVQGLGAIILGIMGLLLLITAFLGFCPAYTLFNINTDGDK